MRIVYRRSALEDLDRICSHIAKDNPAAAQRVLTAIRTSIERLSRFPHSARTGDIAGTRELVITNYPYIAVYRVNNAVEVLAVFHGRQDRSE